MKNTVIRLKVSHITSLLAFLFLANLCAEEKGITETPEQQKRRIVLQEKYKQFPVVVPNTKLDKVSFTTIDLTPSLTKFEDGNYYAFRFETPKENGDLVWTFKHGKGLMQWYIVPEKGQMFGFRSWMSHHLPHDIPNVGVLGWRFYQQSIGEEDLKPGSGYIMWFQYKEGHVPELTFSLNILSPKIYSSYADVFPMMYKKK